MSPDLVTAAGPLILPPLENQTPMEPRVQRTLANEPGHNLVPGVTTIIPPVAPAMPPKSPPLSPSSQHHIFITVIGSHCFPCPPHPLSPQFLDPHTHPNLAYFESGTKKQSWDLTKGYITNLNMGERLEHSTKKVQIATSM